MVRWAEARADGSGRGRGGAQGGAGGRGGPRAAAEAFEARRVLDGEGDDAGVAVRRAGLVRAVEERVRRRRREDGAGGGPDERGGRGREVLVDVFARRALLVVKGANVPRGVNDLAHRSETTSATAVGFEPSAKAASLLNKLKHFMHAHVYKAEEELEAHAITPERWSVSPAVESLKTAAKSAGLWNLWLPLDSAALLKIRPNDGEESTLFAGPGLTNLEYAYLAEVMGASVWASEAFNCSAPDTGNMEVLLRYGSVEQQERWLRPLLTGEIRSCFAMTEPAVASSDATKKCSNPTQRMAIIRTPQRKSSVA